MNLPSFLLAEVRLTFRLCAQQHAARRKCPFSTTSVALKRQPKLDSSSSSRTPTSSPRQAPLPPKTFAKDISRTYQPERKDLVSKEEDGTFLDKRRKVEVPMKVLPQAQVSSKHSLSPTQRLHIEHLTRHPPKQAAPKVYKERLLIYHFGIGRVNWMIFSRVATIVLVCFVTVIWVPAYYKHGTPLPYIALVWLASFVPITAVSWATRSIATEIWLKLPLFARQSPQAAMTYAKNLPRDASIDLRFMRWTSHTGTIPINVVDTTPISKSWTIKLASFRWIGPRVDQGSALRPNPTEFYIRPKSAEGRAVRDTIPGLWGAVYKRLTGVDSSAVSMWRS